MAIPVERVCQICGSQLHSIARLGQQPVAQDFRTVGVVHSDFRYDLEPLICLQCGLCQLKEFPESHQVFGPQYPYRSGASQTMSRHLDSLAQVCIDATAHRTDPFFLEIGCNDGTLSYNFARRGLRHLGLDPAVMAIDEARQKGVTVRADPFSRDTAREIRRDHGLADVVVAANVIAHIPDVRETFESVCSCLSPGGIFIFEAISLLDVLQNRGFDLFYDEHMLTFSATAVDNIARTFGLELFHCEPLTIQGGSMRYFLSHRGKMERSEQVVVSLAREQDGGLMTAQSWSAFASDVAQIGADISTTVTDIKAKGYAIAGYGATAKSSVALSYWGIGHDLVDCIFDTTPGKVGLTSPCDAIPILFPSPSEVMQKNYLIAFAWNFQPEIEIREQLFRASGGKWITYQGDVRIV